LDPASAVTASKDVEHVVALIKRLFWHSRLILNFDPATSLTTARHTQHPGHTVKYVHLTCHNSSWWVEAGACIARLRSVRRQDLSGQTVPFPGFVGPVPLRWANTPEQGPFAHQPTDIRPGETFRIDVGYQVQGETFFRLYIPKDYVGVETRLPPGSYVLEVEVKSATNLPRRVRRDFQLALGTIWGDIAVIPQ